MKLILPCVLQYVLLYVPNLEGSNINKIKSLLSANHLDTLAKSYPLDILCFSPDNTPGVSIIFRPKKSDLSVKCNMSVKSHRSGYECKVRYGREV